MRKIITIAAILSLLAAPAWAQHSARKYVREGNRSYKKGEYANAEVDYRKAREVAKDPSIPVFDLGASLYQQKKYDKAAENFMAVAEKSRDKKLKAYSYYNLGNTLLEAGKIDEAIQAYKNALRYDPTDMDAKYNLLYAMKKKKQQQQKKQQQKQGNKNQQQKQNRQKNNQSRQNQQQNQQQDQQRDQQQKPSQQQKDRQQQKPVPGQISRKDAERLLQALANDEKKVQEKVKKAKAKKHRVKSVINW